MAEFREQIKLISTLRARCRECDEDLYRERINLHRTDLALGRAKQRQTVVDADRDRRIAELRARMERLNASLGQLRDEDRQLADWFARLAAQRASADDIALLRKSIKDLESSSNDKLKLVSSDLLFHRAIFVASKNRAASSLFQTIHRAMAKMILVTSQLVELEHTLSFHKPIMRAIEQRDLAFHAFLQESCLVADQVGIQMNLLETLGVHEDIVIAILIEIAVGDRLDESSLHGVGGLVADGCLDPVRDAPHVDGCRRRALAGVHAFSLEDDIELAILMLDDIALAGAACDDLDHV